MEALVSSAVIHIDMETLIWCVIATLLFAVALSDTLVGLGIFAMTLIVAAVITVGAILHSTLKLPTDRIIRIDNPPELPRHAHREPYYR